ncbi:hypothetical protein [Hymenobacter psychrophilus]|uniref:Dolichyl-phosphate-mannose-protein mannosyltransferase n=1 Tax=Hymenobacter psychrophilus TaxID=651662 RepID=A0A1H3HID7_9BACT|nr:hypothetical protein [Hymenobacter psychrophilus]SDY15202.1 hypothetical protein SAMN04488069_1069 [Hymenobacter psychrophilus]
MLNTALLKHSHRLWNAPYLASIIIFIGISILFYASSITLLPRGIHEWAQADRLSLALSFYDFGLDFFHPRTFSLLSIDGITGVEFPLQAYLAALLGHLVGRQYIHVIFRLITIGFSIVGYYYLFKIVFEHTDNFLSSLVPSFFLLLSPIFVYYTGNYIPDTASVSLVFVGIYFVQHYLFVKRKFKYVLIAIVILGLASLIKASSIIYLGSVTATLLLASYFNNDFLNLKQKIVFLLSVGASFGIIGVYIIYTKYINQKYQSLAFLAEQRPILDKEMRAYIWERIDTIWRYEYFSGVAYKFFEIALLIVFLYALYKIKRIGEYYYIVVFLVISLIGGKLFFERMGSQFIDHDYYVIAPYMPLVITVVVLAVVVLNVYLVKVNYLSLIWVPLLALFGITGYTEYQARITDPYKSFSEYYRYKWMEGGALSLAKQGIAKDSRILVLGEASPNLSLIYFDRRGIVWNQEASDVSVVDIQKKMAAYGLGYLIMSKAHFIDFLAVHKQYVADSRIVVSTPNFVVLQPDLTNVHW